MPHSQFNQGLIRFLKQSPTPFHCVDTMARRLSEAGFSQLKETDEWVVNPGQGYFVTRNDSSIIAFRVGTQSIVDTGAVMFGAHTDSPCLKVKPHAELCQNEYQQLGVEVYGGVLLAPWFDRDLSIAGRVNVESSGKLQSHLIDFKNPIATIPNLAIHLNREVNDKQSINAQKHLVPIVGQGDFSLEKSIRSCLAEHAIGFDTLLGHELFFYDTQDPAIIGFGGEFIASARLDNLLSCYVGMEALINAKHQQTVMLVCSDHEEVGSQTAVGAAGPMLNQVIERLLPKGEDRFRALARSIMVSTDNAHGVHPNYSDKHEPNHRPILNKGPVIKHNANQRYATNSDTSSRFRQACQQLSIPYQEFVMRSDLACGSTIGPITAANLGIAVIDVGVPTFAMHSIRELAGVRDANWLYQVLVSFCV